MKANTTPSFFNGDYQRKWFESQKHRWLVVLLGAVILFCFNLLISHSQQHYSKEYARTDASGMVYVFAQHFVYLYYYTGYYPIATTAKALPENELAARQFLETEEDKCSMEYGHWSRVGPHAKILAFLPSIWWTGKAQPADLLVTNKIFYFLAVWGLYLSFCVRKLPFTGLISALLVASSPFFVYEVFKVQNILPYLPLATIIIFSLYNATRHRKVPFFGWFLITLVSILFIGLMANFRTNYYILIPAFIILLAFTTEINLKERGLLIVFLVIGFFVTDKIIDAYFDHKIEQTKTYLSERNRPIYQGRTLENHPFWHNIYIGLGDFDERVGIEWRDYYLYEKIYPILKNKHGINYPYQKGKWEFDAYYDEEKRHSIKFEEIPAYDPEVKKLFLKEIGEHPFWYAEIIGKRVLRVLTENSPLWLGTPNTHLNLSFLQFFYVPLLLWMIWYKRWMDFRDLIFHLPVAANAILVYSGKNANYTSVLHFFSAMLIITFVLDFLFRFLSKQNPKAHSLSLKQ